MMSVVDIEIFKQLATIFVLRGSWHWNRSEVATRIQALKLALPQDTDLALIRICKVGWLRESPADHFELTESGMVEARRIIGPTL